MKKPKAISGCFSNFKNKYSKVVGFKPTGWSHNGGGSGGGKKGKVSGFNGRYIAVHTIPYSEHSSILELQEFVNWLNPVRILPTVGGESVDRVSVRFFLFFLF